MAEDTQEEFSFPVPFQVDIISYLFSENDIYRKLMKVIQPAYFSEYQLKEIIRLSLRFFKKYEEIPSKTSLLTEINDSCIETNGAQGIEDYQTYLDKIYEFSFNKQYVSDKLIHFIKVKSVLKGLQDAYNKRGDGDVVLDIMEKAVKVGNDINFDGGYNYKDRIKERLENMEKGVRTENQVMISMIDIDRITKGGLGSGELGVIIGKTGGGKSIFLCNVAVGACMIGKKVAYFTLEANEDILAGRIDGKISSYNEDEMKLKKDKLESAVLGLSGDLIIKEFPEDITTVLDISSYINDMIVNGFKPDLVIVDYIGIVAPTRRSKETRHDIANVCKGLIAHIGKKYKVPVWSAHQSSVVEDDSNINKTENQVKKENLNKVIDISGIAEGKVALSSEVTLLLSLNQNSAEKSQTPEGLRVFVMKNRVGPKPVAPFRMTIDTTRFTIGESEILNY